MLQKVVLVMWRKMTVARKKIRNPLPLVTSSVRKGSDPEQDVVPEEATPDEYLPPGWTRMKLEPDW
jgi:hypothetical protein